MATARRACGYDLARLGAARRRRARHPAALFALALAAFAVFAAGTAGAQPTPAQAFETTFGKEVVAELGALVVDELEPAAVEALIASCGHEADAAARGQCLGGEAASAHLQAAREKAHAELVQLFGEALAGEAGALLSKLPKAALVGLAEACHEAEGDARVACLRQKLAEREQPHNAPPTPADPGATSYSDEVLALVPRELLDALPKVITRFLRVADYRALRQACPEPELAAFGACLQTPAGQALLEQLFGAAVIDNVVSYMDGEIPKRLTPEDYRALAQACDKPGEVWARCTLDKGVDDEACAPTEEALADCVTDDDIITRLFTEVQRDKKAAFGAVDFYVDVAGMLAALDVETVKALHAACPESDAAGFLGCLEKHPNYSQLDDLFKTVAVQAVEEAAGEIAAAGGGEIDKAKYQALVWQALLAYPVHALQKLAKGCEKANPALAHMKSAADIDALLACIGDASNTSPIANPAFISKEQLRKWLGIGREKVLDILRKKERAKQITSTWRILIALGGIGALGALLVLLSPVLLRKKYPQVKSGTLWKSSGFASLTFLLTIALLGVTLLIMRTVQSYVATDFTSPTMRIAAGTFDALQEDKYVESFSELSKSRLDFIKEPLRNVVGSSEEDPGAEKYLSFAAYVATHWTELLEQPEMKHIMRNVQVVKQLVGAFKGALAVYKSIDWLLKLLPILLPLLTVLLYLLPMRDTLKEIATAPARAAAEAAATGSSGGPGMFQRAKTTIVAELKLVWPFLGFVLVFLPVVGVFLSLVAKPLVDMFVEHAFMAVFYIGFGEPSSIGFFLSIGSAALLLGFGIVMYILAMTFFLGSVRNILRSKYHYGQTFAQYKRFWTWGTVCILYVLALPLGYAYLANFVMDKLHADLSFLGLTTKDMILVPLVSFVAFPVVFWALRGFKALNWVRKFPVVLKAAPPASPAAPPAGAPGAPALAPG